MHELIYAIGTHMRPLLFFKPTTSQRTTSLMIAGSFDDYHGEIASLVPQHTVFMCIIKGNAEDRSLKC